MRKRIQNKSIKGRRKNIGIRRSIDSNDSQVTGMHNLRERDSKIKSKSNMEEDDYRRERWNFFLFVLKKERLGKRK